MNDAPRPRYRVHLEVLAGITVAILVVVCLATLPISLGETLLSAFVWCIYIVIGWFAFEPIEAMIGKLRATNNYHIGPDEGTVVVLLWPFGMAFAFVYIPLVLLFRFLFLSK